MNSQQRQPGAGSQQNSPQKTAKDRDMKKKSDQDGDIAAGGDEPDAEDEMAADRMDNEGHIPGALGGKSKKGGDAGQAI
jgi:hypothetical protein